MANVNNMTMMEYMARTRTEHDAGVERPRIEDDTPFEIKDQIVLRIFPKTLFGAAKRWITSEPMATITTWDIMKNKFLAKYCPQSKRLQGKSNKFTTSNKKLMKPGLPEIERKVLTVGILILRPGLVPPKHFDSQFGDDIQNDEEQGADDVDEGLLPQLCYNLCDPVVLTCQIGIESLVLGKMEDLLYVKDYYLPVFTIEKPENKTDAEWTILHRQGIINQLASFVPTLSTRCVITQPWNWLKACWSGKDVSIPSLRVFGCEAFCIFLKMKIKLDVKTKPCMFLGYGQDEFGYRLYDPVQKRLVRSRDVVFEEDQTLKDVENAERETIPQHNDDLIDLDPIPPKHLTLNFEMISE
ncbi:retrovirus-related pol polyprotein from transposon TNT 1-94 [Tanacetum coccineum]